MYFSAFRIYIYSHYCFASVTASISAMYAAFVAVAAACGAPALMVAVAFGIFANLPISLTHYGVAHRRHDLVETHRPLVTGA